MDILITGARSPAALEWARICMKSGHRVWLADSFKWPISRYLKGIAGYLQAPPPRTNPIAYTQALEAIITGKNIQLIIPTCEEIFYLSKSRRDITAQAEWFMPEDSLLFTLHNKFLSIDFLKNIGEIAVPQTQLCVSTEDVVYSNDSILKPVYSRFGQHVIRTIDPKVVSGLDISKKYPWVQQQRIVGNPLCNYALLDQGKLIAHYAYRPKYCLNGAAATYFEQYHDERLQEFIIQFGKRTKFHGQVAFDFIEHNGLLYVIECNPRATSGIHLMGEQLTLTQDGSFVFIPGESASYRVGGVVPLFFGLDALMKGKLLTFMKDCRSARSIFRNASFPLKRRAFFYH